MSWASKLNPSSGKQRLCDLPVEMRISFIFIPKRLKVNLFVLGPQDG
jgi:hypothetical protein